MPSPRSGAVRQPQPGVRSLCFRTVLAMIDGTSMAAAVAVNGGAALQAWTAAATLICMHAALGGYRPRRVSPPSQELVAMAFRALVVVVLVTTFVPPGRPDGSANWLAMSVACSALAGTGRGAFHIALRAYRRCRSSSRTAIVIGSGRNANPAIQRLLRHREAGLTFVGQVLAGNNADAPPSHLPVLGAVTDLAQVLDTSNVEVAVLLCDALPQQQRDVAARLCMAAQRETIVLLSPADTFALAPDIQRLAGMPCRQLVPRLQRPFARLAKRTFDIVGATGLLLMTLPLLVACAVALRLQDGPGVIFRQVRIGQHGRHFTVLKFRTLKPVNNHESDTRWSVENDTRIGAVGRLLRRTSLDELPQLWNVLRGDMSLVGPRPERPYFVELFSSTCPAYAQRHRAPAGMTGWAQVNGLRGNTSIEMRAKFDNDYIDTWSFIGDLKIILLTIRAMLFRDKA